MSSESTWPMTNSLLAVSRTLSMSSNMSPLPDGLTGACLRSGPPETCGNTGGRQRNLLRVFGTSLVVTGKMENSRLRIFSVLSVLPAATQCLAQVGEVGLQQLGLVPGVEEEQEAERLVVAALPVVLRHGERELALRQTGIGIKAHVQFPFERLDDFLVPAREELVPERLHSRVVPEPALGRILSDLAQFAEVRRRQQDERVVGQQLLGRRDGRPAGEREEKTAAAIRNGTRARRSRRPALHAGGQGASIGLTPPPGCAACGWAVRGSDRGWRGFRWSRQTRRGGRGRT